MSQPNACSFEFEDDFEEIPNEFQQSKHTPFSYYNSSKLHSNITLSKPQQKDIKKSHITQYLNKAQQYIRNKTQKISLLKNQEEHRIMTDCTFKPSINKSRSKSARNIKQFLDSQQKHLEKIEEKKEILKERIQQQNRKNMTFCPTINLSKTYKNKENVHQRLYKQKDKEDKSQTYYQTFNHMPKITARGEKVARNMPVGELLYQDAKRRADKQYEVPSAEEKVVQKNHTQQKYAAQKFLKDYKSALCHTNLQQKTEYNQEDFVNIMIQLGYARYSATHNHSLYQEQKKLLQDCFSYLQQTGVTQINVYVFLLALGGIYGIDLNNDEITGVLIIEEEEGKKLHQYFDLLFRNRLFADVSKKENKTYLRQESSFKPAINPGSQAMADKYRCKMIEKANTIFSKNNIDIQITEKGLSHQDMLVICNLGQNLEKEKLRQMKLQEKDPQCTFQPNSQKYNLQLSNSNIGKDKCKELYQNAKAKQQEIQKLATFRSFEQKKKSQSISPRPNYKNSSSISKSNIKSYLQIKDVDKTLARMVAGRQQRNQKRQFQERGERVVKKGQQKGKRNVENANATYEKELLLDADIMVNNAKKKIYIYKGQENKVNEIVEKFAIQCDLDEYSRNVLYQKLVQSIKCLKQEQNSIIDGSFDI